MSEPSQYTFKWKEVAELLVKKAGLKSGLWQISVQFGFGALNAGSNDEDLKPSAIVGVIGLALSKADKPTGLSVDAALLGNVSEAANKKSKKRIPARTPAGS